MLRVAAHSGIDTCRIVQAKDRGGRFPAGKPDRHHLINRTDRVAVYLEGGYRLPGDRAYYPDVDLEARATYDGCGFFRKDGTPYEAVTG